jgi:Mg-chelatase subunit ChlD
MTYGTIKNTISNIVPWNATATGSGMLTSVPTITTAANARPFAAKTILVLTDGAANYGVPPVTAAQQIRDTENIVIHAVTFTMEAEIGQMAQAAQIGGGKHYHTNEGAELVSIFEEIANNLPTILTE